MRRLAIFVEGQTEQEFMAKLVLELARRRVRIEKGKARGGRGAPRRFTVIEAAAADRGQEYYVLIVDCGTDNRVKSDIRDNYDSLARRGYSAIIALHDVYPNARSDIPKIRMGFAYRLKTEPVRVLHVLGVMEVEAWFLAEHTHFPRLHSALTLPYIIANAGFDPSKR